MNQLNLFKVLCCAKGLCMRLVKRVGAGAVVFASSYCSFGQ